MIDFKPKMSCSPLNVEHFEFNELVFNYQLHQKLMQLHFATEVDQKLRQMEPRDVKELSAVELAGLLYWTEMQSGYGSLSDEEKGLILQKYAVKKISLDHFYSAAKHPEKCSRREFVMNNYTFVPANRTGFETEDDDEERIQAKRECFARTFDRFCTNIIHPFVEMKITDAEIVFMHVMLMWSASNNANVTPATVALMESRRVWAKENLQRLYGVWKMENSEERAQKMMDFVKEVEIIAEMHCEDFVEMKRIEEGKTKEKLECEELYYGPEKEGENSENLDPKNRKRKAEE